MMSKILHLDFFSQEFSNKGHKMMRRYDVKLSTGIKIFILETNFGY